VCIALVVDGIGRVAVRGPLEDARLALLAVEAEGALVGAEGGEVEGRLARVLLPLAQPPGGRGHRPAAPSLLHSGEHSHLHTTTTHHC
jgi:hypothetical protein